MRAQTGRAHLSQTIRKRKKGTAPSICLSVSRCVRDAHLIAPLSKLRTRTRHPFAQHAHLLSVMRCDQDVYVYTMRAKRARRGGPGNAAIRSVVPGLRLSMCFSQAGNEREYHHVSIHAARARYTQARRCLDSPRYAFLSFVPSPRLYMHIYITGDEGLVHKRIRISSPDGNYCHGNYNEEGSFLFLRYNAPPDRAPTLSFGSRT